MTQKTTITLFLAVLFAAGIIACNNQEERSYDEPAGPGGWLDGDIQEKFDRLAAQHQGFSRAMQEVGYRYTEMYFAGKEENWELATYHGEKIVDAMELGFERRPDREASAETFINETMPQMLEVFENENEEAFEKNFKMVKRECNTCHGKEEVAFINVKTPEQRLAPVGWEE